MQNKAQHVFIIGAPRSGTSWLHNCLVTHPDIAGLKDTELRVFNEYLHFMLKGWRKEEKANDKGWAIGLPQIMDKQEFLLSVRRLADAWYDRIPDATNARWIIDKHPGYSLVTRDILEIYPEARFIHIIRDGRDAVASFLSAKERIGFGFNSVVEASGYWKQCVKAGIALREEYPEKVCEIRYEDLRRNGSKSISDVLSFLKVEHNDSLIEDIIRKNDASDRMASSPDPAFEEARKQGKKTWKEFLSNEQIYLMHREIGGLLERLGYIAPDERFGGISKVQRKQIALKMKFKKGIT